MAPGSVSGLCGPFALDPASQRSWRLDDEWLIRKLRGALDISSHTTTTQIADGVWDIGRYKKRPVVLARRIDLVERHGLRIFHGPEPRCQSWVITPRPLVRSPLEPLAGTAMWWQLEDRFALHGLAWRLLDPNQGETPDALQDNTPGVAVHGPFSEDFAWVHLEGWPHGPIYLTQACTGYVKRIAVVMASPSLEYVIPWSCSCPLALATIRSSLER